MYVDVRLGCVKGLPLCSGPPTHPGYALTNSSVLVNARTKKGANQRLRGGHNTRANLQSEDHYISFEQIMKVPIAASSFRLTIGLDVGVSLFCFSEQPPFVASVEVKIVSTVHVARFCPVCALRVSSDLHLAVCCQSKNPKWQWSQSGY